MTTRWPIQSFGFHGYVDQTGAVIVPPTLEDAHQFSEGLAAARTASAWGYFDVEGCWAIAPQFEWGGAFERGRAIARRGGMDGVIDRNGVFLVAPEWNRIERDGHFYRVVRDERIGWVDGEGSVVVPPEWKSARGSTSQLLVVEGAGGWCILDVASGRRIALTVDEARWPGVDSIPARVGNTWGFLRADGTWAIHPAWEYIDSFVRDRAPVRRGYGEFGLIDRAGREVLPLRFVNVIARAGGWLVEDSEGRWLFDDEGQVRAGPWRAIRATTNDGPLFIQGSEGWGALAADGRLVVPEQWEDIAEGGEGLFAVKQRGVWGALDPTRPQSLLIEPRFSSAPQFRGALAAIDEGRTLINREGRSVWHRPPVRIPHIDHPCERTRRPRDWARVREALPRLAAWSAATIFGSRQPGGHRFSIGAPLALSVLEALEAEHRVTLPEDLRTFLLEVGDGPAAPKAHGGAGPGYGLYGIAAMLAGSPRAGEPFVPARSRAEVEIRREEGLPPGLLEMGTHGCAWDYGIAVTGPWAGTMWAFVDPGWIPESPARAEIFRAHHGDHAASWAWMWEHLDEIQVHMFAEVYLAWLDDAEISSRR